MLPTWSPPALCTNFLGHAQRLLADKTVSQKTVFTNVEGEPESVVYVAMPYRNSDNGIDFSINSELATQDVYAAAGIGRLCAQTILVGEALIRRIHRTWEPFGLLAEASVDGWQVPLDASLLRSDAARIALLDFVLANDNRHGWSVFLDKASGRVLSTDHARCFGEGNTFGECFRRAPLGDLQFTNDEADEARRWWSTVERSVFEALEKWRGALGDQKIEEATSRSWEVLGLPPAL